MAFYAKAANDTFLNEGKLAFANKSPQQSLEIKKVFSYLLLVTLEKS